MKRTWLDKAEGSQRRLGMPVGEDNIVQRAVTRLGGAGSAQDVQDGAPGWREGHSPHQARQALREQGLDVTSDWSVEAEVRGGFDNLDHGL